MRKENLIKRLRWYYPMEKFHAYVTFPLITLNVLRKHPVIEILFLLYGLALIIFILMQGQHYWKLKLYRLTDKEFDQRKNLDLFLKVKTINNYLIALIPAVLLLQLYLSGWKIEMDSLMSWALAANLFAILEHINYYYRQLTIDNSADVKYVLTNRRLKVSSLAKDLKDNEI